MWKAHIWTADRSILSDTCTYMSILYWFTANSQNEQPPVGLIAQLVEHSTSNAELMGSIPIQAWIFSGFFSLLFKKR